MNRRESLITLLGAMSGAAEANPVIIETHVHLFSDDLSRFPAAPGWQLRPSPLERYISFARQAGIANAIHVSAEPYQHDLRYLHHSLDSAPKGFLKGTLLLDPIREDTPQRMAEHVRRHPGRIVALRIHCTRGQDTAPTTSGPLRDRDLMHPGVRQCWKTAGDLGIAIQAHIQPWFTPQVGRYAAEFPGTRIILDHFGHAGVSGAVRTPAGGWTLAGGERGYRNPQDFDQVLRLAKFPNVVLKVSSLQYSSGEAHPYTDLRPLARKAFDAFGPDRMVWGSLGSSMDQFRISSEVFEANFDFLSTSDRSKIQGLTAKRLFGFA